MVADAAVAGHDEALAVGTDCQLSPARISLGAIDVGAFAVEGICDVRKRCAVELTSVSLKDMTGNEFLPGSAAAYVDQIVKDTTDPGLASYSIDMIYLFNIFLFMISSKKC